MLFRSQDLTPAEQQRLREVLLFTDLDAIERLHALGIPVPYTEGIVIDGQKMKSELFVFLRKVRKGVSEGSDEYNATRNALDKAYDAAKDLVNTQPEKTRSALHAELKRTYKKDVSIMEKARRAAVEANPKMIAMSAKQLQTLYGDPKGKLGINYELLSNATGLATDPTKGGGWKNFFARLQSAVQQQS